MHVRITSAMLDALKAAPDLPENLRRQVSGVAARDGGFVLTLDEDETMAMTEMCQWYIRKDPVTGKLGAKAEVFDAIVRSIYAAEDQ